MESNVSDAQFRPVNAQFLFSTSERTDLLL